MEIFLLLALVVAPFVLLLLKTWLRGRICASARDVGTVIARHFLTQPCSRCHEFEMVLLSVSPNARSIQYECRNCNKKSHAAATGPDAFEAAPKYQQFQALLARFNQLYRHSQIDVDIVFQTPEAPLPFEQTKREPINEAVRTEVWRRDGGRCAKCGSNQQLEFDHIIPVSRGGATSARNLQLLCKSCNLGKGAKV